MDISEKEVLRYLGFHGATPDMQTRAYIEEIAAAAELAAEPKNIYGEFSLVHMSHDALKIGEEIYQSKAMCRHLRTSERVLAFSATLGIGADRLLRRFTATESAKAAVAQAVLAAMIESYCDTVCETIAEREQKNGWYLRPRFSPGYGDLPLTDQKKLFKQLEITKRIGVTLTDTCLMLPTKSVTAFIGLTRDPQPCGHTDCMLCGNADCAYRTAQI